MEMKRAFTLVEILIMVAVLGILAAIVLPTFQTHAHQATESAAKDNLRILRNAIEMYSAQHRDVPPGYPGGDTTLAPSRMWFVWQLTRSSNEAGGTAAVGTAGYNFGPYFGELPKNPFNDLIDITEIGNDQDMPAEATGATGWIYKAATKDIRLDWPGSDSQGVAYYDY